MVEVGRPVFDFTWGRRSIVHGFGLIAGIVVFSLVVSGGWQRSLYDLGRKHGWIIGGLMLEIKASQVGVTVGFSGRCSLEYV